MKVSETLQNVPLEPNTWTDLYAATGLPVGDKLSIQNISSPAIKFHFGAEKPTLELDAYRSVKRWEYITNDSGDSGAWAYSHVNDGLINVGEVNLTTEDSIPTTSFDEVSVAETTPIVQISAQYGVEDDLNVAETGSGSHSIAGSLYSVSSGTSANSIASLNSSKQAAYKAGQGMVARTSCLFDTPQSGTLQAAGLITAEDSIVFGYVGMTFGIIRAFGGKVEAQELTLNSPANNNETATITIDGDDYLVDLTGGSVEHNCWEIAVQLTPQLPNYLITSNQNTVYVMATLPDPRGAYGFTSNNASGTFGQKVAGASVSFDFIPQSFWNSSAAAFLDPQKGNIYTIKFSYLGFSGIEFYVKDPTTNKSLLVHTMRYGNSNTVPIVRNPTFRIGWVAQNTTSTTNVTVRGASAMVAREGKSINDNRTRALENIGVTVGQTPTNVLTLRSRSHFGDIINRASIQPTLISLATDSTRGAVFKIILNGDFADDLVFSYLDETNSICEYAEDPVEVTGGRVIASFSVTRESPLIISSSELMTTIETGEYFSIVAKIKSGNSEEMDASITFIEDL